MEATLAQLYILLILNSIQHPLPDDMQFYSEIHHIILCSVLWAHVCYDVISNIVLVKVKGEGSQKMVLERSKV